MFKYNQSNGFTLFEIVALISIIGAVFAFGTPKYLQCIHDTHNSNIDVMVGTIKIWSAQQAVENLNNAGHMKYPLPNNVKLEKIMIEGKISKWDDSDPTKWKYIAGGGIEIKGDGTYLEVNPIHLN